jgi:Peptidase family M28
MSRALLAVLPLVACSSTPKDQPPVDDAPAQEVDAALPPDAAGCAPTADCDWLVAYQKRIVGALSGNEDIAPGVKLLHRASVAERNAARQFLMDEFTALGLTPMRHDYTTPSYTGANVIARLDATAGTGETIIVGAHFDGVSAGPGAADNATGVAIVLATARYLKDLPVRNHPVVFALFDQEELGLIGSKEWVKTLTPAQIHGAHIFDMLSFDGDGDHAVELWSPSASLLAVYQTHGPAANTPISAVTFQYSDHQAFLDAGIAATGVGEEFVANDHTPHYHKATDTYANVSFDHLARVSHLALAVLDAEVR